MKIAPNSPCLLHSNQYLLGGMWGVVGSEGSGVEQTMIMVLTTACVIKRAQITGEVVSPVLHPWSSACHAHRVTWGTLKSQRSRPTPKKLTQNLRRSL